MQKSSLMLEVEKKLKRNIEDLLKVDYFFDDRSSEEITRNLKTAGFKIHHSTIFRWAKKLGYNKGPYHRLPPGFNKPSPEQLHQWHFIKRKTFQEIAELLGLGKNHGKTVWRWYQKYQLFRRDYAAEKHPGVVKPDRAALEKLALKFTEEAAEEIGVASTTMRSWLKKEGLYHPVQRVYNMPQQRKKVLDLVARDTKQSLSKLEVSDFTITIHRRVSYLGLLIWYQKQYECSIPQALTYLIREFYPRARLPKSDENRKQKIPTTILAS